ncbi:IclR family transcriptional regulator C-terminal domain-containing protein [Streptomyces sp. NPDC039028]|uniref:IclR family transcriptional regulator n=1 Tax=unclassified Streptomyces TaxID=2593676 RepID=UPI0033D14E05
MRHVVRPVLGILGGMGPLATADFYRRVVERTPAGSDQAHLPVVMWAELGVESLRRMDEVALVSEHLPGLRDRTSHAVDLAVWGDHGPVVVRWEYGAHALPITVRVGATMPLLNSAMGGAFLAHLPERLTEPVLRAQLETDTLDAVTRDQVDQIKDGVLRAGVATTVGGVIPGVTSVAAPVFTAGESFPLVVTLVMPARGLTDQDVARLSTELLDSARAMSEMLGHPTEPRRS